MLSFSGKKSRGEQRTGPVFVGMVSTGKKAWKGSSLFPFQVKMSRRAKNRACVQQVREGKPRSKESNGGVLSNGGTQRSTINKVKAC
ncbi:hypothetical protein TNCT_583251 [Trichonephila clavata]|uniref:Uncharacterized protein n=1 Tax=Trichonephila clavata TaxID=2740835 RepID=A0A8X6KVB2_TRICU|nr:hypothetical protein TNCT_583251 [Trichonephila clavata]